MPSLNERRSAIAKGYCRVMAVIDDAIFEETNNAQLTSRFAALHKNCEEHKILCHLHNYPKTSGDPASETAKGPLERARDLALNADVVILDWNLGQAASPQYALALLKDLSSTKSVRFVVIYTQEELASVAEDILKELPLKSLSSRSVEPETSGEDVGQEESEDIPEQPAVTSPSITPTSTSASTPTPASPAATGEAAVNTYEYHLDNRLFVALKRKEGGDQIDANALIDQAHRMLRESFPDHLHWAGLEMAVRSREEFPQIVASIPPSTDGALIHQMLFQRKDEVSDQVAEVLLDELRFRFQKNPLAAVTDDTLFIYIKEAMVSLCADEQAYWDTVATLSAKWKQSIAEVKAQSKKNTWKPSGIQAKQLLDELKLLWDAATIDLVRTTTTGPDLKYFPFSEKDEEKAKTVAKQIDVALKRQADALDHRAWASVRESIMADPGSNLGPGYVLKRKSAVSESKPEWLLCITSACDCYRPAGKGYLFVVGSSHADPAPKESNPSETQTCIGKEHVTWDALRLEVLNPFTVDPREYDIIGAIRAAFTARIIQRVWSYQSRVGVDTSELFRALRKER